MQSLIVGLLFKSVSMTIVGLIFIVLTPLLLKRYRTKWLFYGWLIILIGFVLPFSFDSTTKVIHLSESAEITPKEHIPIQVTKDNFISVSIETISMLSIWETLMIIWILGIFIFLSYHLVRHYFFMMMVKRWSKKVDDPCTIHMLEKIKNELNLNVKIKVKQCSFIHTPILVGFINHSILLPIKNYGEEELSIILKHELVHLKRKDLWYKAFVMVVYSIHWFNPILYLFAKEIDNLCERSCDDEVLKNADIELRKSYSQTILYAEKFRRSESVFSTNFIGSSQSIKKRIQSIMEMNKKKSGIIVIALLLLLTMCGFSASSVFTISNKPISYLDETFMKESILKGERAGDFSTDKFIIDPTVMEMKPVPVEPDENKEVSNHNLPVGIVAYEARYRYPIEIIHRNKGNKYTTLLFIEYDYELFKPIKYDELNSLIASYLLTAEEMFKSISYTDFNAENLFNRMQDYKNFIDKQNTDSRVDFTFRFNGMKTNLNFSIPEGMDFGFQSTPRYMLSLQ